MNIKNRLKSIISIKNISELLFLILFFNLYFLSISLYFSNFSYFYLLGNLIIVLLFFIRYLLSKKIDLIINLLIFLIISIFFVIFWNEYVLGFKIEMNNLFTKSQELTSYKYSFYSINALVKNQKDGLFINNLINSLLFSLIIFNIFRFLKGYLILIFNIFLIILSIYFGVPFNNACVILLILLNFSFILLNIYFNSKGYKDSLSKMKLKNIGILLSFSLIFTGLISVSGSSYTSIPQVTNISNSIRDYFNNPINEKDNSNNKNNENSDNQKDNDDSSSDDRKDEAGKTVSRIPILLIVLLAILSVLLLIPIILTIKELIKNKKNKELLNSSDIKTLIKSNYLESIKILRKIGIKYQNKGYLEYINDLKDFDKNYQNLYINASNIYLKSSYSNNKIEDNEIKLIKEFYEKSKEELFKRSKGIKRIYWRIVKKYE